MKPRSLAIARTFGIYSLGAFAVAFMIVGLQLAVDGACCCLQSERED
jgi:hypothetical protein